MTLTSASITVFCYVTSLESQSIFNTKRTNTCFTLVGDFASVEQKRSGIKRSYLKEELLSIFDPPLCSASHTIDKWFGFLIPV